MDQSHQTERDLVTTASNQWELAWFAVVLAAAEQLGTSKGDRQVINVWIAFQGALQIQNAPVAEPVTDVVADQVFAATAAAL
jgi:hypothetical protein